MRGNDLRPSVFVRDMGVLVSVEMGGCYRGRPAARLRLQLVRSMECAARWLARSTGYTYAMIQMRLTSSLLWVDVRLLEINGRWIASADTTDGPSLGLGDSPMGAIESALEPFDGVVDELLASVPFRGLG